MSERADNLRLLVIRLALVALVAAVYWPAAGFGYVQYDDLDYINPVVRQGLTTAGVEWAFDLAGHVANWHPVTWLSLMLDTSVFGDSAAWHHVVNIALHAVNVLLLLGLLRAMTGKVWRSAIVAALLAVHPMHVESVAWVSERKDVLSMMFWLLTMRAYVSYTRDASVPRYLLVMALFALGLMSKPMVVTLPFVLLLLDIWPLQRLQTPALSCSFARRWWLRTVEKAPMFAASGACMVVTRLVQRGDGSLTEGRWMTFAERLEMVVVGYTTYPAKMIWPDNLAALYPNLVVIGYSQWSHMHVLMAAGALVLVTTAALVLARRAPWLLIGWLWYVVAMIPVIGLVQIGRHTMADRYAYIPFVGLYIIAAWGLGCALTGARSRRWSPLGAVAAAVTIAALAAAAHHQVWVWKDSRTLFAHASEVTERNWFMRSQLAKVLAKDGHVADALTEMQQAVAICRDCAWVHTEIGEMLLHDGQWFQAEGWFRSALKLDPDSSTPHTGLGASLIHQGRIAGGIEHLRRGVELAPQLAEARKILAVGLVLAGEREQAVQELRTAIALDPDRTTEYQSLIDVVESGVTIDWRIVPRM